MSFLVKETDTELYLKRYVHDESDSFSDWEMNEDGMMKYSEKIQEAEAFAFYELVVEYKINKKTGEVTFLEIR